MDEQRLAEKKRKFESGFYDSVFTCPLCQDTVGYLFAYIHLKECVTAYEELYVKKFLISSVPSSVSQSSVPISLSQPSIPPSLPQSSVPPSLFQSSAPPSLSQSSVPSSVSQSSVPPSLPQSKIIRFPKCAFEGCNLSRQKPIFIKLKDREIKLCAFSHLKDGLYLLPINYPHDYLQISGSMCHNCEEIFDYVIKLSESYRKDSEFQLVF